MSETTFLFRAASAAKGALAIAAVSLVAMAMPAHAEYPDKQVHVVIPYPPGGPTDIAGRLAAAEWAQAMGANFVVENKTGAGGTLGSRFVARAEPDGHTLLINASAHVIYPTVFKDLNFDVIEDFTPVTQLVRVPMVLLVNAETPVNNVQELVAYIKKNPGKFSFASAGNGGAPHLAGEWFKQMAGLDIQHVPYRGSAPALADLAGGQVQLMFDSMTSSMTFVRSGKLKALAVTSPERSDIAPELPTMAEAGLPDYKLTNWYGVWAPKGTPPEITKALVDKLSVAFRKDSIVETLRNIGAEPVVSSPDEFARFVVEEKEKWGKIAQTGGASAN